MIEIRGLCKSFGATPVLKGIDLCMAAGRTVAVIGESGSGKSTLVRCINHLERIDDGSIRVGGTTILPGRVEEDGRALSAREGAACGRGSGWCFRTSTCFRI